MKTDKKTEVKRRKEFGLHIIEASIYALASMGGKIKKEDVIKDRIVLIKDKLKREMRVNRIYIKGIDDVKKIDTLPPYERITIYLNPYYELEVIKNLEPFPISTKNHEGLKWLNDFESYLAINFLYYREFRKPLKEKNIPKYTNREIMEAKEIIIDYYDLENPKSNPLEKDQSLLYYYPKPNLVENAEKDVLDYEVALLAKALMNKDVTDVEKETGFDKEKVKKLLKILITRADKNLLQRAKEYEKELK
ncbi:MAG: hypothetical protein PWQ37_2807 [Candidatus Petromonas sp.]|nr:hypothetical protein [Petrotoga sp.]MDK2920074.1 hypothetical protein [Candidatus Petromonas sp.]